MSEADTPEDNSLETDALYPFRDSAVSRASHFDLDAVLADDHARARGLQRVVHALTHNGRGIGEPSDDPTVELHSYLIARLLVSVVDEYRVTNRYVTAETRAALSHVTDDTQPWSVNDACAAFDIEPTPFPLLEMMETSPLFNEWETLDMDTRQERIDQFLPSLQTDKSDVKEFGSVDVDKRKALWKLEKMLKETSVEPYYRVSLDMFLRYRPANAGAQWSLVNRALHDGAVITSGAHLEALLSEAIRERIDRALPIPEDRINEQLTEGTVAALLHDELDAVHEAIPQDLFEVSIDRIERDLYPPLITSLLDRANKKGHLDLTHKELVALVSFLMHIGMEDSDIVRELGVPESEVDAVTAPNHPFGYQLHHLRDAGDGEPYTPPTYETIKSWQTVWAMDELEKKVSHPLGYYRIKLQNLDDDDDAEGENDSTADSDSGAESEDSEEPASDNDSPQ
jgi:DNA primase large subunit